MNNIEVFLVVLLIVLTFTVLFVRLLIPYLKKKKVEQKILEDGPVWHKKKEGTPSMGGLGFLLSSIIAFIFVVIYTIVLKDYKSLVLTLNLFLFCLLNGLIGLIDDLAKLKNKANLGLKAKTKLFLQILTAILFVVLFSFTGEIETVIKIPFSNFKINIGMLYYPLAILILAGFVNAVNLTDGLDGLASSVTLTAGIFLSLISLLLIDSISLSLISACLVGSTIGFLFFNLHPAKIFMGDTGSLFLGAMVVCASFAINDITIVLLYGFIFLCEALSDIIQVLFFKISKGKRVFKMAPLHHHLEKCGWSEMKIVYAFMLINALFCTVAYLSMVI